MTTALLPLSTARCPACGQAALTVTEAGALLCTRSTCYAPHSANRILSDATVHHVVQVNTHDFDLEHPLIERVNGVLFDSCVLVEWLQTRPGPPVPTGRYVVKAQPADHNGLPFAFERVLDPDTADDGGRTPHAPDAATRAADVDGVPA